VVVLRCTKALCRALRLPERLPEVTAPSGNRLGDLYAHILFTRPQRLLLVVTEHSLLPLVPPARDLPNIVPRLQRALSELLVAIGAAEFLVRQEIAHLNALSFSSTKSKRILGTLNDFARILKLELPYRPLRSPLEWAMYLGETPCTPLGGLLPREVSLSLLTAPFQGPGRAT
jgi:hypothetical protein